MEKKNWRGGMIGAGAWAANQLAAWRQVQGHAYDLVVLLGTNHTTPNFTGLAVWNGSGFRTPLGVATIDAAAASALLAAEPACKGDGRVHEREHSIEVQVPFAQVVLPGVAILPIVVSCDDAACATLGQSLARSLGQRRVLYVASSDLSHYPQYDDAVAADAAVLRAIATLDDAALRRAIAAEQAAGRRGLATCACGEAPVRVAMAAARAGGARRGIVLSAANSGDAAVGDPARVVGYGAVMFTTGPPGSDVAALEHAAAAPASAAIDTATQHQLLDLARHTIARYLDSGTTPLARGFPAVAERHQGAFVTLRKRESLRGCIGHMAADRPLCQVVGAMSLAAAFEDRRFQPLAASELADVEIEISVLTPLTRVAGPDAIVVGRDGVQIQKSGRAAVFLPQVATEQGWDRPTLLTQLCRKAGLPDDAWKSGATLFSFRAIVFSESEFH